MNIAIIKYNAGNIRSVLYALERLNVTAAVTDNHDEIRAADKIIFPGVGEASSAMKYLKEKGLDILIPALTQPVLGICLGMQLMCNLSEENDTKCLGIFHQKVLKFRESTGFKIPQIGWNNIYNLSSPLFDGIKENEYVYFVHSFYAEKSENSIASTNYIQEYSSALHKDNFYATQFHPEKSGDAGQKMLWNFLNLC